MYFIMRIEKDSIPASVNQSYGKFGFWKFGLGCWVYSINGIDYDGEIEWINTLNFCSSPKLKNPKCFRYRLAPGLKFYRHIVSVPISGIADAVIGGVARNWAKNKNLDTLHSL